MNSRPFPICLRRGFTLVELLIVMGVIGVLSVLTLVSVKAITADARLSSATNTVAAALGNARALAMKKNQIVLVAFRPKLIGDRKQVVEVITAAWSGQSFVNRVPNLPIVIDRFVETDEVDRRSLPMGIKVAGPQYEIDIFGVAGSVERDQVWVTQSHLPAIDQTSPLGPPNEVPGGIVGVMYAPDGTTITQNPRGDSTGVFIDFNNDQSQTLHDATHGQLDYESGNSPDDPYPHFLNNDEPVIVVVPYLAVYDDVDARDGRTNDWTTWPGYEADLIGDGTPANPGYITLNADRIHFNRYTGVVMK